MRKLLMLSLLFGMTGLGACRDVERTERSDETAVPAAQARGTTPPTPDKPGRGDDMHGMHGMNSKDHMAGMCAAMMSGAKVTVENTSDGAVIRMSAENADGVQRVQQMASMMRDCMTPAKPDTAAKP